MSRTPYTYIIKFTHPESNKVQYYYGAKYGKDSNPDDLWNKYKTSSKVVKSLLEQYGEECFEATVDKIFSSVEECLEYEHNTLTNLDVYRNDLWLNQSNNKHKYTRFFTQEHKDKISQKSSSFRHTQETKDKISDIKKGVKLSESHRAAISEGHKGQVAWNKGVKYDDEMLEKLKTPKRIKNTYKNIFKAHEVNTGKHRDESTKKAIGKGISEFYKNNPGKAQERALKASGPEKSRIIKERRLGTKAIFNEKEKVSKFVKIDQLEEYFANGWRLGMK